jgi:hypothetical protein
MSLGLLADALAAWKHQRQQLPRLAYQGDVLRPFEDLPDGLQNVVLDLATVAAVDQDGFRPVWKCLYGKYADEWLFGLALCGLDGDETLMDMARSMVQDQALRSKYYGSRLWLQNSTLVGAQQVTTAPCHACYQCISNTCSGTCC